MSATGAAPRATIELRVRVWGMGANGQPFHQNATAQNVSITGACISGIEQELKVGDVIGVQYETKKARCKVIWVSEAAGLNKVQVGVQLVADQECPWLSNLPAEDAVQPAGSYSRQSQKISTPQDLVSSRIQRRAREYSHASKRYRHQRQRLLC